MKNIYDVLKDFTPNGNSLESLSKEEMSSLVSDCQEELCEVSRKFEKAKNEGKSGKKLKKKFKKLKKKHKELIELILAAKQQPNKGRWERIIERSAPELVKLATMVIDRKLLSPKDK